MITEDYVSLETAKLLKEKGFDEKCMSYYGHGEFHLGHPKYMKSNTDRDGVAFNGVPYDAYNAPTLQLAMKWLRENFNINPVPYALSLGWAFDIFDLSNRDITGCKKLFSMDLPSKSECYNSYEESCEKAIKYCLENLI